MRTGRRVMVCVLWLCAAAGLWAQQPKPVEGSVDSSVTVTGRDDSLIPVPPPSGVEDAPALPLLEPIPAGSAGQAQAPVVVPPVPPPVADTLLDPPRDPLLVPAAPGRTLQ